MKFNYKLILKIYIVYILKTMILFYHNPKYFIGQDRILLVKPEHEYTNYPICKIKLEKPHKNLYEYMLPSYRINIANPKSRYRRKQINNKLFGYSKESVDKIISYSLKKINSVDDKIDKLEIVNKASKNSNKLLILIANDGIIICGSHLLHDGLSIFNMATESSTKGKITFPYYSYIPIYNEFKCIKDYIKILRNSIPKTAIKRAGSTLSIPVRQRPKVASRHLTFWGLSRLIVKPKLS